VERNGVSIVQGEGSNVGIESGLLKVKNSLDIFMELMG
jgi:hypothetical protein